MAPQVFNRRSLPQLVTCTNDGIVATAGMVEGFSAAAVGRHTVILAAIAALTAGGLALGGSVYTEFAAERDAMSSTVRAERSQLASVPDAELEELRRLYVDKGLSADLAGQVAAQLSAHDALGAHLEAEHGIGPEDLPPRPLSIGAVSGLAFALGALVPLLAALFVPAAARVAVTFAAAIVSLGVTSALLARVEAASVARTVARALTIGAVTMLVGLAVGRLLK